VKDYLTWVSRKLLSYSCSLTESGCCLDPQFAQHLIIIKCVWKSSVKFPSDLASVFYDTNFVEGDLPHFVSVRHVKHSWGQVVRTVCLLEVWGCCPIPLNVIWRKGFDSNVKLSLRAVVMLMVRDLCWSPSSLSMYCRYVKFNIMAEKMHTSHLYCSKTAIMSAF